MCYVSNLASYFILSRSHYEKIVKTDGKIVQKIFVEHRVISSTLLSSKPYRSFLLIDVEMIVLKVTDQIIF